MLFLQRSPRITFVELFRDDNECLFSVCDQPSEQVTDYITFVSDVEEKVAEKVSHVKERGEL